MHRHSRTAGLLAAAALAFVARPTGMASAQAPAREGLVRSQVDGWNVTEWHQAGIVRNMRVLNPDGTDPTETRVSVTALVTGYLTTEPVYGILAPDFMMTHQLQVEAAGLVAWITVPAARYRATQPGARVRVQVRMAATPTGTSTAQIMLEDARAD